MAEKIKVLIVDDHAVVRTGLRSLLESDPEIEVVAEAGDGNEAIQKTIELKPDVVLMDMLMPEHSGVDAIYSIAKKVPESKVLVLSVIDRLQDVEQALKFGARGYLLKSAGIEEITNAVKRVAANEMVLSPRISKTIIHRLNHIEAKPALSKREHEIIKLIGEGLSNHEIASKLFITESTVRTHLQRITEKLQIENRADLILYAVEHRLTTE